MMRNEGRLSADGAFIVTGEVRVTVIFFSLACQPVSWAHGPEGSFRQTAAQAHVVVWDAATGAQLIELDGHRHGVVAVAFAPQTPELIASVGTVHDGDISLWNWRKGTRIAFNRLSSQVRERSPMVQPADVSPKPTTFSALPGPLCFRVCRRRCWP